MAKCNIAMETSLETLHINKEMLTSKSPSRLIENA